MLKFPKGTKGYQIDVLARCNLWEEGVDFNHGTGHGVGSFLNVHEGPQSISKKYTDVDLQEGMKLFNYLCNHNYQNQQQSVGVVIH